MMGVCENLTTIAINMYIKSKGKASHGKLWAMHSENGSLFMTPIEGVGLPTTFEACGPTEAERPSLLGSHMLVSNPQKAQFYFLS